MAPKLIQCIKFSFSLTAEARFRWTNNKSVPHSSSVFACRRGKNTCAPSIVYRLLIGWNCHTTWSQGNLHYMRLHFLKLDREFFCLQPSLARLYSAAASPSERLRSDGSLAITDDQIWKNFVLNEEMTSKMQRSWRLRHENREDLGTRLSCFGCENNKWRTFHLFQE